MPIVEHLLQLFRPDDPPPEDPQKYREALADLLVWTMFVDHHVALAEQDVLDSMTKELDWVGKVPLADFLRESTARTRGVLEDGEAASAGYLEEIAQRIGGASDRRRILKQCGELVNADGKLRPEEIQHLRAIEKAFDL